MQSKPTTLLRINLTMVRGLMEDAGLGGRELARRSHLHRNTVWAILHGKLSALSLTTVNRLAAGLGVSPFVILEAKEEEAPLVPEPSHQ